MHNLIKKRRGRKEKSTEGEGEEVAKETREEIFFFVSPTLQ